MYKYFLVFFYIFFLLSKSSAEIVNNIKISGNERISSETIKIYGDLKLNKDYSETEINKILKSLYKTEFFEDVKVDIKNNTLNVVLKEYPFINQLIIVGEKSNNYKDQIKKIINLKEKKSFIKSYVLSDLEKIKSLYSSAGYNSANVEIKTNKITASSLTFLLKLNEVKKLKLEKLTLLEIKVLVIESLEMLSLKSTNFGKYFKKH